jgi:hypothetical protein
MIRNPPVAELHLILPVAVRGFRVRAYDPAIGLKRPERVCAVCMGVFLTGNLRRHGKTAHGCGDNLDAEKAPPPVGMADVEKARPPVPENASPPVILAASSVGRDMAAAAASNIVHADDNDDDDDVGRDMAAAAASNIVHADDNDDDDDGSSGDAGSDEESHPSLMPIVNQHVPGSRVHVPLHNRNTTVRILAMFGRWRSRHSRSVNPERVGASALNSMARLVSSAHPCLTVDTGDRKALRVIRRRLIRRWSSWLDVDAINRFITDNLKAGQSIGTQKAHLIAIGTFLRFCRAVHPRADHSQADIVVEGMAELSGRLDFEYQLHLAQTKRETIRSLHHGIVLEQQRANEHRQQELQRQTRHRTLQQPASLQQQKRLKDEHAEMCDRRAQLLAIAEDAHLKVVEIEHQLTLTDTVQRAVHQDGTSVMDRVHSWLDGDDERIDLMVDDDLQSIMSDTDQPLYAQARAVLTRLRCGLARAMAEMEWIMRQCERGEEVTSKMVAQATAILLALVYLTEHVGRPGQLLQLSLIDVIVLNGQPASDAVLVQTEAIKRRRPEVHPVLVRTYDPYTMRVLNRYITTVRAYIVRQQSHRLCVWRDTHQVFLNLRGSPMRDVYQPLRLYARLFLPAEYVADCTPTRIRMYTNTYLSARLTDAQMSVWCRNEGHSVATSQKHYSARDPHQRARVEPPRQEPRPTDAMALLTSAIDDARCSRRYYEKYLPVWRFRAHLATITARPDSLLDPTNQSMND